MSAYEFARKMSQLALDAESSYTTEIIREKVNVALQALPGFGYTDAVDGDALVRELETVYSIWMGSGTILDDKQQDHIAWLPQNKAEIEWNFWDRYRKYLEQDKGWSPFVVDKLEQLTDQILERLENPERQGVWDRRGMVVGQVQSGKTSNYTGLICKALDAGYKLVIVLAGLHNSLRSQTQLRMDEGVLGFDSQLERRGRDATSRMGVGRPGFSPKFLFVNSGTSSVDNGDFSTRVANQYGVMPGGNDPVLMVVKKNKSVLKNLLKWASSSPVSVQDPELGCKIVRNVPLLVIDDEADNASVNTKAVTKDENDNPLEDQNVTAINGLIRELLRSFEQSAYVGYTATPFANIFIHQDVDTKEHGEDLFPKHFIINLPAPSNYVGPVQVFGLEGDPAAGLDESEGLNIIRKIEDQDKWMPAKHKIHHVPERIPESLKEAIRSFVLTCAVRIWRGQQKSHNSMLVHVTRYTNVQSLVSQLVKDYVTSVQRRLRYGEGNAPNSLLEEFKYLWASDYAPTTQQIAGTELLPVVDIPTWQDIEPLLYRAAARIQVKQINGKAQDILDYWESRDEGLNVIAIGGNKLSRGLTLEGLSVSYYLRASKMYDTLMQMGRWFGYRPGYLDLCRLYTTDELVEWYRHITIASEELRKEFDYMVAAGGTPRDYGLKVRTHPAGLLITSSTKMRQGKKMMLSFAGSIIETNLFFKNEPINQSNFQVTEELLLSLGSCNLEKRNNLLWQDVEAARIVDFLRGYQANPNARLANTTSLIDYIQAQQRQGELIAWTVALISSGQSSANKYTIAGQEVGLTIRQDAAQDSKTEYRLKKSRIVSPTDEMLDFEKSGQDEIIALTAKRREEAGRPPSSSKTPDGKVIREKRDPRNGLVLIYPLDPSVIDAQTPVIGFAISFPGSINAKAVEYKVNNIYWEQETGDEVDED